MNKINLYLIGAALCFIGLNSEVSAKPTNKKIKPEPSIVYKDFEFTFDKVDFNTINAPVFSTTEKVLFQTLKMPKKDGRFKNMMNAVASHQKEQPPGWEELIQAVAEEGDDLVKLKMANSLINKVPYKDGTDGTYYHPAKLWKKGGVCKDMAISKYLLLKDSGYPVDKMRIAVLTPKVGRPESPFHVVLVAKTEDQEYVLDLIPSYLAEQERKKLKTTKEKQIKEIREAGLDLDEMSEKELLDSKGFYSLEKYVSERGLVWAGNESGTREQFALPPKSPKSSKKKK